MKTIKQLEQDNEREYRLKELNKIMPGWVAEHRFHPKRDWAFDYAHLLHKIAVEIEGGVWTQGRHTRGAGYIKDLEKYNAAAIRGWTLLRFETSQKIEMSETVAEALLQNSGEVF